MTAVELPTEPVVLEHRPALVADCELSAPVGPIEPDAAVRYQQAWLLVRIFDEPIGLAVVPLTDGYASEAEILTAVRAECEPVLRQRAGEAGADAESVLKGLGAEPIRRPTFLLQQAEWLSRGPAMTVVICTRDRPEDLSRALDSLAAQSYQRFDVLVVDNAPSNGATELLVAGRPAAERIRYVREPRRGLSFARNRGLAEASAPVLAWLDDDETADRHWLMQTAAAFCRHPESAAVSGVVVPAELHTQAQLWFEQYGGHSKGRGFTPEVFSAAGAQSPLFPLPAFGVGANMAFRTDALRSVGGFDVALGAGTLTQGGEDTLVFTELLLRGHTVVYQPTAVTRHYHRRTVEELQRQMRGYGIGLTAYYSAILRRHPLKIFALLRLAPAAARTVRTPDALPESFPPELQDLKARAMLLGPIRYLQATRAARRRP